MTKTIREMSPGWYWWGTRLRRRGWNALRVVLFFAVSGAILCVAALLAAYVYVVGLDLAGPQNSGVYSFKRWASFRLLVIMGSEVGFVWGGLCSVVAIRRLRGKVIWKAACWVVPACLVIVVSVVLAVELMIPASSWWLRRGGLLLGSPLLALWFVGLAHRLPDICTPGYCKACEYDLTGNVSGVCPECGTAVPKGELVGGPQNWPGEDK